MTSLERIEAELKDLLARVNDARREEMQGRSEGAKDCAEGCDCGRGSSRWLEASRFWREGYEAGWKSGQGRGQEAR